MVMKKVLKFAFINHGSGYPKKPQEFQALTFPKYRCVSFCMTRLKRSQEILVQSLVFKTTGFLEQTSSTSLLQSGFFIWLVSAPLSNA